MKKLPKLNLSKLGLILLAVLCVAVVAYDMAGAKERAKEAAPSAATQPPEPPAEAQAVSAAVVSEPQEDSFYAEYRLQREQVRAEELEMLRGVIEDVGTSKELRDKANERKLQIAQNMEYELMTENVLLAKDFGQTVVMLGKDAATVVLAGPLDEIEAAQVAEAVSGVTGVAFENIVIIDR